MERERGEDVKANSKVSKLMLADLTKKKIDYYLSKNFITDVEVYSVFKEFFSEMLEIRYEFTCLELKEELNKVFLEDSVERDVLLFIDDIRAVEYQEEPFGQDKLKELLKRLKHIVDALVIHEKKNSKSFFAFLFGKKQKPVKDSSKNLLEGTKDNYFSDSEVKVKKEFSLKDNDSKKENINSYNKKADKDPSTNEDYDNRENDATLNTGVVRKVLDKDKEKNPVLDYEIPEDDWTATPKKNKKLSKKDKELDKKDKDLSVKSKNIKNKKNVKRTSKATTKKSEKKSAKNSHNNNNNNNKSLSVMIKDAKKLKDKKKLLESYKLILEKYNGLSASEQDKYFDSVNKLYEKVK
ncbi:hypothetical protein K9L97_03640 [Candidatus Woesearchaeota archaeon]|nr:hypothetical protein [Candidatus Woesearchaeota archaeon]